MIRAAVMAVLFSKSNNDWSYETETLKVHIVHIDFAHHSKKLKFVCALTFLFCVFMCVRLRVHVYLCDVYVCVRAHASHHEKCML